MACVFPADSYRQWYKFYCVLARSRYKLSRSQKTVKLKWILIASRCAHPERSEGQVQEPLQICLESSSKSKKCDKQLTYNVCVMGRIIFVQPILLFIKSQVFEQICIHSHCYFFIINISIEFNYYFFSSVA
jgi:hypothetical protein